jgi:uncharacterized protein YndB with AHSA1/START domain
MSKPQFVYVTYISATQEKIWEAFTKPEFQRQFWMGCVQESTWERGASWTLKFADGSVGDTGEILEIDKPNRIVIRWRNEFRPELKAEGYSICTFALEPAGELVKLTITHEIDAPNSKFIAAVSGGWPKVLSNLKTLLETGKPMPNAQTMPKCP